MHAYARFDLNGFNWSCFQSNTVERKKRRYFPASVGPYTKCSTFFGRLQYAVIIMYLSDLFVFISVLNVACTHAVGWSKKPEFVTRSPSWIRAARTWVSKWNWFCVVVLQDGLEKLAPIFQPIRSKTPTKTNGNPLALVFPRFASAACNYEFWLDKSGFRLSVEKWLVLNCWLKNLALLFHPI